ncbi:hypothetical protein EVAR_60377_1 [Eumeta japonica]|uniref:Reverse transcriptase domain-containing protein n=1 Tax=Eumeta variegata TaxID=151549 RepID=A0A4C1ZN57_EUMVA|nr:hypothetical protein EVAR_60377_1 [Eumeta japonica]
MDELSVKCFLYADDQVLLAPSACGLQEMVNKMNDSVKKKGLKVNVSIHLGRWNLGMAEEKESRINAVEMRSFRDTAHMLMCGVPLKDRCSNGDVRRLVWFEGRCSDWSRKSPDRCTGVGAVAWVSVGGGRGARAAGGSLYRAGGAPSPIRRPTPPPQAPSAPYANT